MQGGRMCSCVSTRWLSK